MKENYGGERRTKNSEDKNLNLIINDRKNDTENVVKKILRHIKKIFGEIIAIFLDRFVVRRIIDIFIVYPDYGFLKDFFSVIIANGIAFFIINLITIKIIKSDFFIVTKIVTRLLVVLIIITTIILSAVAQTHGVSDSDITILAGFMALNAGLVWLSPNIPKNRPLLKSTMVAIPASNWVVAASFVSLIVMGGGPSISPIAPNTATLTIVNNCDTQIEYQVPFVSYCHVKVQPFGIQNISIPAIFFTIDRDASRIVVKGIKGISIPPIEVQKETLINFDGMEIKPGSETALDIIPGSSHKLIIGCRI